MFLTRKKLRSKKFIFVLEKQRIKPMKQGLLNHEKNHAFQAQFRIDLISTIAIPTLARFKKTACDTKCLWKTMIETKWDERVLFFLGKDFSSKLCTKRDSVILAF